MSSQLYGGGYCDAKTNVCAEFTYIGCTLQWALCKTKAEATSRRNQHIGLWSMALRQRFLFLGQRS